MFYGWSKTVIDPRGRLVISAKIREKLGDSFVLMRLADKCIYLFTQKRFTEIMAAFANKNILDSTFKIASRIYISSVHLGELDAQGRIVVPQVLRDYAGLVKNVTVIGTIDHAELWDSDEYDRYKREDITEEQVAETMRNFNFSVSASFDTTL